MPRRDKAPSAKGLPRQLVFPAQEHSREESGSERENGALLKEV